MISPATKTAAVGAAAVEAASSAVTTSAARLGEASHRVPRADRQNGRETKSPESSNRAVARHDNPPEFSLVLLSCS
jgi:hypothetical protein